MHFGQGLLGITILAFKKNHCCTATIIIGGVFNGLGSFCNLLQTQKSVQSTEIVPSDRDRKGGPIM